MEGHHLLQGNMEGHHPPHLTWRVLHHLHYDKDVMPSSTVQPQGMFPIPSLIEGTQSSPCHLNIDEIPNVEMYVPRRTPPRILHKNPKFLINIDEDIL